MRLLRGDFLGFMEEMTRLYGPVWQARVAMEHIGMINEPELVYEALTTRSQEFVRTRSQKRLIGRAVGNGLILSDGDFWRRQRRLAQPAFHQQRLRTYLPVIHSIVERFVSECPTARRLALHEGLKSLTLEIVAATLLGTRPPDDLGKLADAVDRIQVGVTRLLRVGVPLPAWLPTPNNRRLRRGVATLNAVILPLIAERRQNLGDRGDLLSMFLMAADSENDQRRMTDEQVRDEVATMFLAGHDTTSHLLAWTFLLLARHPSAYRRIQEEADQVLTTKPPGMEELRRLTYTEMVLKEVMRLYPPVYLILREPVDDLELGGFSFRRGQMLLLCPWMLHRDPRNFRDPAVFDPGRFAPGASSIPQGAYLPFGAGPHQCIGREFGVLEALMIVSLFAQKFDLELAPSQSLETEALITLAPRDGVEITIHPRGSRTAHSPEASTLPEVQPR
jgi:cytochrome P450